MFQAIVIDLADVFAGSPSCESPGLELELLIKRFLCFCVRSPDLCVINTFGVPSPPPAALPVCPLRTAGPIFPSPHGLCHAYEKAGEFSFD